MMMRLIGTPSSHNRIGIFSLLLDWLMPQETPGRRDCSARNLPDEALPDLCAPADRLTRGGRTA
jgi:hypothetical protein